MWMDEIHAELAKPSKSGPCTCEDAAQAMRDGVLVPVFNVGWVFTDLPCRGFLNAAAAYYAIERGIDSHEGEPIGYTVCPWCGCELPEAPESAIPTDSEGPE